ncbi:hypothetical protein AAF712_005608 [Marasmius tenuissimus]|uniref:Cation efflux protein transmembrane domain-containing protein n=1 Tax=Marasmius tenuissimus TaxID=585030 RepID=A0ABR3A229_9AGAR
MPTYRRLQQYALGISVISIVYCAAEGAVSIGLGAESSSRSLVFFGIQSGIEVLSATMVVWRFWHVAKPGEERGAVLSARDLKFERISSTVIACLLLALALATEGTAIFGLVQHEEPSTSNASLIVSASALVLMILVWLPKGYLARKLNSSAMQGETQCSLSCIQMTIVLFVGALVYKLWKGGWWVDSATSLILGLLFGWEGWKMWRWARSPNFDGGCCGAHHSHEKDVEATAGTVTAERSDEKKDSCECSSQCDSCKTAVQGKLPTSDASSTLSAPIDETGKKCCGHECRASTTPPNDTTSHGGGDVANKSQELGCPP